MVKTFSCFYWIILIKVGCNFNSDNSNCNGGGFNNVSANSDGNVDVYGSDSGHCNVTSAGNSYCNE